MLNVDVLFSDDIAATAVVVAILAAFDAFAASAAFHLYTYFVIFNDRANISL